MYNEKIKQEFIELLDVKEAESVFRLSEHYEKDLGKDLYEMEVDELLDFILQDGRTFEVTNNYRNVISKYLDFCKIKSLTKNNWISIKIISREQLRELYNKKVHEYYLSPEHYERYKEILLEQDNGLYMASIFASIYEGLSGTLLINLTHMRLSDINEKDKTIKLYDGKTSKLSEELISLLKNTAAVTTLYYDVRTTNLKGYLYYDSVWKTSKDPTDESKLYRQFRKILAEVRTVLHDDGLRVKQIMKSGHFNRIYYKYLNDGIDIRDIKASNNKDSLSINKKYNKYFEDGETMTGFIRTYNSYLQQV